MTSSRIAFVTPGTFPIPSPLSSSVERVVEELTPHLASGGLRITVHGRLGRGQLPRESRDGIRYVRHACTAPAGAGGYIRGVAASVERDGPDLVQVENRPAFALRLKKRNPSRRVWLALHSTSFVGPPRAAAGRLRSSLAAADRIVVNSAWLRDAVTVRLPEAAPKIRVVHLGVDTERFPCRYGEAGAAVRSRIREAHGWRHRSVVLFMGRLIPKKGAHVLVRILPQLAAAHPEALFVIVGSPHYGSHAETDYSRRLKAAAAPHVSHIRFVPYVPYRQVPEWFLAADIAVVPSGDSEAFGLVNVEAMATGLPVIATAAGGMPEIVADGRSGFLVPAGELATGTAERLMRLLGDEPLRERMGREGRRIVEERFTWRHAADRWLELLHEADG